MVRRDAEHQPVAAKALALGLPRTAWQTVTWREGSADWLSSRFARIRVRPAHRDYRLTEPRAEEWLMVEWPETEAEPTKYWLSTLAEDIDIARMVDLTKLRWRIERDYQDLKQELGLGHYEGRGSRGFHHHAALCVARRSKQLPFPLVIDPEAPPLRPERHVPNSISTIRRRIATAIARSLQRCPCCKAPMPPSNRHRYL